MSATDILPLFEKITTFKSIMEAVTDAATKSAHASIRREPIVVEELEKMSNISSKCNHKMKRNRNKFGFERTPTNWAKIPTLIDDMTIAINTCVDMYTNLRQNPTLAMFMSNFSTMMEVRIRSKISLNTKHVIVCSNLMSTKHLCLIMALFKLLFVTGTASDNVIMYMSVTREQQMIAETTPIGLRNVVLCKISPWYTMMDMIEERYRDCSITAMINGELNMDMVEMLFKCTDVFVCMTTATNMVKYSHALSNMKWKRGMMQEMVIGSDSGPGGFWSGRSLV
ncbi:hypothetical protein AC578_1274 [Pseudocercospora eumusae]|uniref:Uncharacterized protein n=1 Tax=Pseudocercospora eumusae TaxID=321146 RepID=A0A139HUN2_9PEZI|nr:hypothetical protein AC578_1274 [Pseudocercospora eumusae]